MVRVRVKVIGRRGRKWRCSVAAPGCKPGDLTASPQPFGQRLYALEVTRPLAFPVTFAFTSTFTFTSTLRRPSFAAMAAGGETPDHAELKRLALTWAQTNGFPIAALEVRVPKSGYRADVAACGRSETRCTAVFECKQSRADLLKDAHAEAESGERLQELIARRQTLESLLAVHRPDLRRGEALWPEYDTWDFERAKHTTYTRVLAELATAQRRVVRGTKFSKMLRYRCADFLYLVVQDDIYAEAEIPAGWGLLVRRDDRLQLARRPADLRAADSQRLSLLEQIALAGTRATNRAAGVAFSPARWTTRELPKL